MVRASGLRPSRNSGFTLVELLVVITIIGILMGLLIPAVNAAREAARRNQCSTQINNLAKGTIQFEMAKRRYPGWLENFGQFNGAGDPSDPENLNITFAAHAKLGTWAVSLLPYLDAQPTYEVWTEDKYPVIGSLGFTKNSSPNLPIMQCPSSPTIEAAYARNSYVSNNGMHPFDPSMFPRSMSRANGVFNNKYPGANTVAVGDSVRADDLKDGQGNTVLFTENLQALPWSNLTVLGYAPDLNYPFESRYVNGFVWHYRDPNSFNVLGAPASDLPKDVHRINGPALEQDKFRLRMNAVPGGYEIADFARPSSAHVSGVNMGFADGSSKFVTDNIDYRIYQAYMTPRGKSSDVPFPEYVLQGEEL